MLPCTVKTIVLMGIMMCLVQSHPSNVHCDLSSTVSSSDNVMTKSSIMGDAPDDRSDLMAVADSSVATVTLNFDNLLNGGLVLHATNGNFELPTDKDFQTVSCTNGAALVYLDETSSSNTVSESMTLQWSNTSIGSSSVVISLISGESNAVAVRRQVLTLPEAPSPSPAPSSGGSDATLKIVLIVVFVTAFLLVAAGWAVYHFKFHGKLTYKKSGGHGGEEFAPRASKRIIFHPHGHDAESNDETKQLSGGADSENNVPL